MKRVHSRTRGVRGAACSALGAYVCTGSSVDRRRFGERIPVGHVMTPASHLWAWPDWPGDAGACGGDQGV